MSPLNSFPANDRTAGRGSWLFVHVPKCGGTSVLQTIRETTPQPSGLELNGDDLFEKKAILDLYAERLAFARVVYGHRVFAELRQFMPQPVRMVTVLRHPIDRAISHYNFILTRPRDRQRVHGALTRNDMRVPFADWLEGFPPAANHLVWMLFHVLSDSPRVFDFSRRVGPEEYRVVSGRLHEFTHIHFAEKGGVDTAIRQITGRGPRVENMNRQHFIDPADPDARSAAAAVCYLDALLYEQAISVRTIH
jgi:hypothetical protein